MHKMRRLLSRQLVLIQWHIHHLMDLQAILHQTHNHKRLKHRFRRTHGRPQLPMLVKQHHLPIRLSPLDRKLLQRPLAPTPLLLHLTPQLRRTHKPLQKQFFFMRPLLLIHQRLTQHLIRQYPTQLHLIRRHLTQVLHLIRQLRLNRLHLVQRLTL